jgi:A/G-specific adenine glycosylase
VTGESTFRAAMVRWHEQHARSFPWRESRDPYQVLIGELLLQRTRADNVADVYVEFLKRWPTPEALAAARVRSIESVVRSLGLTGRARTLKAVGLDLSNAGRIPTDPERLELLRGVGPYVAHAVPIFAEGRDLPLVDWVIARVLRRYFGLPIGARPNADRCVWGLAESLASHGSSRELWLGTLDFAAAVCKPRPLCPTCPLASSCAFTAANHG